jgi:hypothetical protein
MLFFLPKCYQKNIVGIIKHRGFSSVMPTSHQSSTDLHTNLVVHHSFVIQCIRCPLLGLFIFHIKAGATHLKFVVPTSGSCQTRAANYSLQEAFYSLFTARKGPLKICVNGAWPCKQKRLYRKLIMGCVGMVRNERCRPQVLQPQPVHLKELRLLTPERRPRRARIDLVDEEHGALGIDDICS